jgi:hypothetical protein
LKIFLKVIFIVDFYCDSFLHSTFEEDKPKSSNMEIPILFAEWRYFHGMELNLLLGWIFWTLFHTLYKFSSSFLWFFLNKSVWLMVRVKIRRVSCIKGVYFSNHTKIFMNLKIIYHYSSQWSYMCGLCSGISDRATDLLSRGLLTFFRLSFIRPWLKSIK